MTPPPSALPVRLGVASASSAQRVLLVALALLVLGLLHVITSMARVTDSAVPFVRETVTWDAADPSEEVDGPVFELGMPMPARGPPMHRPGCAVLSDHHREARFIREDACFSRPQIVAILRELVVHAAEVFHAHNITYFLASGTLLGAYRHHDVIPRDFDGDLAIDVAGFTLLQSQRLAFDEDRYVMDVWNSPYYENAGRDAKLSARLIHKASALYVDVFVFHDRVDARTKRAMVGPVASDCFANCVYCTRLEDGRKELLVPREWVYPLQNCSFGGHMLQCPAKTIEYLTHEYGESFMTPI